MHIVIIAWLYITAAMALAFNNGWAGAAFFASMGVAPVMLYAWLAVRRRYFPSQRFASACRLSKKLPAFRALSP